MHPRKNSPWVECAFRRALDTRYLQRSKGNPLKALAVLINRS